MPGLMDGIVSGVPKRSKNPVVDGIVCGIPKTAHPDLKAPTTSVDPGATRKSADTFGSGLTPQGLGNLAGGGKMKKDEMKKDKKMVDMNMGVYKK
jgi:hypothetical protein